MDSKTSLVINCIGGANLGRCYNSAIYEVLTHYALGDDKIKKLWEIGVLGCGQEYRLVEKSTRMAKVEHGLSDAVVFRAVVEIRCDSGD